MKRVKEYLVEKFTEDSDPISDMGIGIVSKLNEKLPELILKADKQYLLWSVAISNNEITFHFDHARLSTHKEFRSEKILLHTVKKIINDLHLNTVFSDIKLSPLKIQNDAYGNFSRAPKVIGKINKEFQRYLKTEEDIFLNRSALNDYINEKFIENSDPIQDMEIGNRISWETLKRGDVIYNLNRSSTAIVQDTFKKDDILSITYVPFAGGTIEERIEIAKNWERYIVFMNNTKEMKISEWEKQYKILQPYEFKNK
jgi:ribosomal protein L31E